MATELTEHDEGKHVVHGSETIGTVVEVKGGTAHVDPDADLTDKIMSSLDWGEGADSEETYPLPDDAVAEVTDDEIRLEERL